jgi:hypothetical protein
MKFVLKVLVLALLIVASKLAKNEGVAMEKPAKPVPHNTVYSSIPEQMAYYSESKSPVSSRMVKSSF